MALNPFCRPSSESKKQFTLCSFLTMAAIFCIYMFCTLNVPPYLNPMSYGPPDHQQFLKRLVVICGTQKGGTSSLMGMLREQRAAQLFAYLGETHYFDKFDDNLKPHALYSMDSALRYYYGNTDGTTGYIDQLSSKCKFSDILNHPGQCSLMWHVWNSHFVVEKTPENMLYPHIASILANDFVRSGTKLIILLRDPTKRFISGYFHEKNKHEHLYTVCSAINT